MLARPRDAAQLSERSTVKAFPQPFRIGNAAARWRLSDVAAFESERTGKPAPEIGPANERYLSARVVAQRMGVSASTVWRWALEAKRATKAEAA